MIKAELPDGTILEFPDGTEPQVMQAAVKRYMAENQQPMAQPMAQQIATDTVPQDQSYLQGLARDFAQGVTFGFGDEFGAALAAPAAYALKNLLPESMGGENVSFGQVWDATKAARQAENQQMAQFQQQNPVSSALAQIAGGVGTGIGVTGLAQAAAPQTVGALAKWAAANPYKAAAGIGGGSGYLYELGTGEGDVGERATQAIPSGVGGVVLGPAAAYVGRNVVPSVLGAGGNALSKVADSLRGKPTPQTIYTVPEASSQAATAFSNITNQPMQQAATSSPIGRIALSPAVRNMDTELLRIEENARQGMLGTKAQEAIQAIDSTVNADVRTVMQSLAGQTNKGSKEILVKSIDDFRDASDAAWKRVGAMYEIADEKLIDAAMNKKRAAPSLGTALDKVVNNKKYRAGFKTRQGEPARQLFDDFKEIVSNSGDEIEFADLVAWRQNASDLARKEAGSQTGTLASALVKGYDDWLENIKPEYITRGDAALPDILKAARQARSEYGKLYQSNVRIGESKKLENIAEQYAKSPDQFVETVFGKNLSGNNDTAQVVKRMSEGIPEANRKEFTDNVFSGLIVRAFEKSTEKGGVSYPVLRNSLNDIVNSETYKTLLSDKQRDTVLKNLIDDLNLEIKQRSRTDIRSPSGGHIGRIINTMSQIPVVGAPAQIVKKSTEVAGEAQSRIKLDRAIKEYSKNLGENVKVKTMDSRLSMPIGVSSGIVAGNLTEENK